MKEEASAEQKTRKFVIKYSYGNLTFDREQSNADDDLRNEYHYLKRLRGAEHIGQLIDFADCSLNIHGISNGEDTYEKDKGEAAANGSKPTSEEDIRRRCPTFALEYLSYNTCFLSSGTTLDFIRRLYIARARRIPNRLLWRIWLCMVRQCVAMAYPPDIPNDQYVGQLAREVIQDKPIASITQNSSHYQNFMFSEAPDPPGNEHEPGLLILKLIDFGRGKLDDGNEARRYLPTNIQEYASKKNLEKAASTFVGLACYHAVHVDKKEAYHRLKKPIECLCTDKEGNDQITNTRAPPAIIQNSDIDPQLRSIILRIFAHPWVDKPSLKDVLEETEIAVTKGPDHPGYLEQKEAAAKFGKFGHREVLETDEAIKEFVQKHIYDAY
ncbi:hypothetical protein F5Y10DRAFT_238743 [Nemania abortiva]|nr:hypothetical protein F5Y10DRAFT_238743 [Nemania abortiva]